MVPDETVYVDEHKWIQEVEGVWMFRSNMVRSYPLMYLQKPPIPHLMNWSMTKEQDGIAVGNFGTISAYKDSPSRSITSFLPSRFNKNYPLGKISRRANTFLNKFLSEKG